MSEIPAKMGDRREHYDRSTYHVSEKVSQVQFFGSRRSGQMPFEGGARFAPQPRVHSVIRSDLMIDGRIRRSPCRNYCDGNGEIAKERSWCGSERAIGELVGED
jgi:hypothetical protein